MRHNREPFPSMSLLLVYALVVVPSCSSDISQGPPGATFGVAVDSTTLLVGHVAHATARDASGRLIDAPMITWTSRTPEIATVSPSGDVTALASGSAVIDGRVGDISDSTTVTIVLASHDFNDGTIGPYYTYSDLAGDLDFPDDPTSSGKGKVARFHYLWAASNGSSHDANRAIEYDHPVHFGETMYFKGDFYFPVGTDFSMPTLQRKLVYWKPHVNYTKYGSSSAGGPVYWSLITLFGATLKWDGYDPRYHEIVSIIATGIQAGHWYTLEQRLTTESSIGAGNGVVQIWLDGVLVFTKTDISWSDPAWIGQPIPGGNGTPFDIADLYFERFDVGDQTNYSGNFDEYRFWDNVAFSTTRIGR